MVSRRRRRIDVWGYTAVDVGVCVLCQVGVRMIAEPHHVGINGSTTMDWVVWGASVSNTVGNESDSTHARAMMELWKLMVTLL